MAEEDARLPRGVGQGDQAASDEGPDQPDGDGETDSEDGEVRQAKAPWHFKVIVVGSVIYLGYRLYQGITWVVHHV